MIKVLVVDDHPSTAHGLAALLDRQADLEVLGVAGAVEEALRLVSERRPDVVVCDIDLNGAPGGFEIARRLQEGSGPAVLLFSSFDYPAFRQRAFDLRVAGYLLKTASLEEIAAAIRRVAAGGTAFNAVGMRDAALAPRRPSDRELELIRLVRTGLSNDEAAVRLGIGTRGVESSLRRLFGRYGVFNRTALVELAVAQGWLALADKGSD